MYINNRIQNLHIVFNDVKEGSGAYGYGYGYGSKYGYAYGYGYGYGKHRDSTYFDNDDSVTIT